MITTQDANATVTRPKGTPVGVQLEQHSDCGYSWSVDPSNLGTPSRAEANDGNAPGALTLFTYAWNTQQVAPGTYPLKLAEAQPFAPNSPQGLFMVTVVVTP